ncbi:Holliday junction resolvase RecU [Facklamia sp. DSM 111018]|uniref:Holliday junction resolvase RecU n=1 Tax=Facklamia lactis TaxID=2749967 RepID=A0ABS0LMS8_9LACT|nr:Holliday junction resolvase RecU [Facklamia lactis]MBG9979854.1 Holliday junction resolvase RecU [Facklamia lactis]MBG9985466.1 Holliday junction resolvase RecU [Facklamia lactis]
MINYPAGQGPHKKRRNPYSSATNYSSRGMSFEDKINQSNLYYLKHQIAVIHKKPTPIQVVKVDYPKRSAAKITEAYYRNASTTDYNGIYKGLYIDFETKETKNKTSFPLSNLHDHQLKHMHDCYQHGGVVFLLISFRSNQTVYLLPFKLLQYYLDHFQKQSIPYEFIEQNAFVCSQGIFPPIDYIQALDKFLDQQ